MFIFSKQESFIRVYLFVFVFAELQEVMVMLLGIDFGHDWIEIDSADFLLWVFENVWCLIVGNNNFTKIFVRQWSPN